MGRGRRKKRKRRQRRQAQLEQVSLVPAESTTCPLCRDPVDSGDSQLGTEVCGGCAVAYHRECVLELGGCATLGCERRGQVPSAPLSSDPAWDRYRARVAAEAIAAEALAPEEADHEESRAARYARGGGKLGALLGGGLGLLSGGILNSPAGFNLSKGLQTGVLGALAGAVYFGLSAGLIGRLGIKKEPVFGSEFFLLISVFIGLGLGGTAGSLVDAFGVGAATGVSISFAISLRLFGFAGRTRGTN